MEDGQDSLLYFALSLDRNSMKDTGLNTPVEFDNKQYLKVDLEQSS